MIGRIILTMACCLAAALPAAADSLARIEITGTELVVHSSTGRSLRGDALVGAVLGMTLDGEHVIDVRIDAVLPDPHAVTKDILVYSLSTPDATGAWMPVCKEDPYGDRYAILQPAPNGTLAIWCTGGTHAKCIRFGYRPWASGPNGVSLERFHLTCSKMLRADYCGNDQATTRTGMLIDIYDRIGIRAPEEDPGDFAFEAAWDENGAICVAHPRVPQNISLEQLVRSCPRLRGRIGTLCTEANAARFGNPLIFNASRGDGIIEAERRKQ